MLQSTEGADEAVLVQLMQRDVQALGLLYDRYGSLLYTLALRIMGEASAAETVVQMVFQALWQSADGLASDVSVARWLITRTRQQALTMLHPGYANWAAEQQPYAQISVDAQSMQAALQALTAHQRAVIEHAYYGGFTCAGIAAQLGQPLTTVKTALRQGLLMLHKQLQGGAEKMV